MRRSFLCGVSGLAGCLLLSLPVIAGGRNVDDYPLRVHIFQNSQHSHYRERMIDYVDGEGRANLCENGEPRGFDYNFRCGVRLMVSAGFETYPARWKKAGKELEILLPVMGKPGAFDACGLMVEMKDTAYIRHGGTLEEEPSAVFKEWMQKHQYDPEKGLNEPVTAAPAPVGTPGTGTGTPRQNPPQ